MLDILELAEEKGIEKGVEQGKTLGIEEGKTLGVLEATRDMVLDALIERFQFVSSPVSERIRALQNPDVLKSLFHQAFRCHNLRDFEVILQQVH